MKPERSLNTQMTLRGIHCEPSSVEIRELVRYKFAGFEIRQFWRQVKRKQAQINRERARSDADPS